MPTAAKSYRTPTQVRVRAARTLRDKGQALYGHKWQIARDAFLKQHPTCARCEAEGRCEAATVVDHIVPHRGDYDRFWDRTMWQPLCTTHHNRKTAEEDGGFGRSRQEPTQITQFDTNLQFPAVLA